MKSFVIFSIVLAVSFAFPTEGDDSQHVDLLHQKSVQFRIVGGEIAKSKQFPYHTRIEITKIVEGKPKLSLCGGALISNKIILTAAHCLDEAVSATIILGVTAAHLNEPTRIILSAVKKDFMLHEKYNSISMENDIALITLKVPVKFNDGVQIISLPTTKLKKLDHTMGIISGSGKTGTNSPVSKELRFALRKILPTEDCLKYYPTYFKPELHVCVDGSNKIGNCPGDSGGPLVITQDDGTKTVVGLTSFAGVECDKGYPTISTRVSNYLSWIEKHAGIPVRN